MGDGNDQFWCFPILPLHTVFTRVLFKSDLSNHLINLRADQNVDDRAWNPRGSKIFREEMLDYADYLGIPLNRPDLIPKAVELSRRVGNPNTLPDGWKEFEDEETGTKYYGNPESGG